MGNPGGYKRQIHSTRVSSYNPWLAIHWVVSGKGRGGDVIWAAEDCLDRHDALRHWTAQGAWFSRESGKKGQIKPGQFADIAVLDRDYFAVPEDDISNIEADLTVLGSTIVHAKSDFADHGPAALDELPDWSPVPVFGAPGITLSGVGGGQRVRILLLARTRRVFSGIQLVAPKHLLRQNTSPAR